MIYIVRKLSVHSKNLTVHQSYSEFVQNFEVFHKSRRFYNWPFELDCVDFIVGHLIQVVREKASYGFCFFCTGRGQFQLWSNLFRVSLMPTLDLTYFFKGRVICLRGSYKFVFLLDRNFAVFTINCSFFRHFFIK